MSAESTTSAARDRAARAGGGVAAIVGPLQGYHHETYVAPLPDEAGYGQGTEGTEQAEPWRWKFREPRAALLWFDRRCFLSEEELLVALAGRVRWIPEVKEKDGFRLQRFIEGRTLGASSPAGTSLPDDVVEQIITLFRQLVAVAPGTLTVKRRCLERDRVPDGDTAGFLKGLIRFTEERVYLRNEPRFGRLFKEFAIDRNSFQVLRDRVKGMESRPFTLLHGDLHRENFIVDPDDRLWTIDWELAMVGDPLYDLATHLHLMRYPQDQADEVAHRWRLAVEDVRAGSAAGCKEDLELLLAYKRAQSVFTDVIRTAEVLGTTPDRDDDTLHHAAAKLHQVLTAGAPALGLPDPPECPDIELALKRWA
ncbi:phosphotransferase [Streptomyces sp. p1417]|uniref:Phosphotransferase n=1 Tax=Streptomyces typhae TaxID=2681492 RepID=A0A6L6X2Q3_9ACTN|nr:aminoglycoside phosphotransferase family protein [Streptomyces typhae]MVO87986.1 phosphotransferase [Streptomyces typhae]